MPSFSVPSVSSGTRSVEFRHATPNLPASTQRESQVFHHFRRLRSYGLVLIATGLVATIVPVASNVASAKDEEHTFNLVVANAKLLPCLAKDANDTDSL